jgi:methionine aminopeptidase
MVVLRSKNEIEGLRRAGDLVARALVLVRSHVRAGVMLRFLEDGWTVVTADNGLSAQYEHTIAVTAGGCEILTPWHLLMPKTAELA